MLCQDQDLLPQQVSSLPVSLTSHSPGGGLCCAEPDMLTGALPARALQGPFSLGANLAGAQPHSPTSGAPLP